MKRRDFLKNGTALAAGAWLASSGVSFGEQSTWTKEMPGTKGLNFPIRAITKPPGTHWFGYYDKLELDPTSRYALVMKANFDQRHPEPDDKVEIFMVDLEDDDRWTKLGESVAWGWQQGCLLQWIPGSKTDVIWNDREGDQFVSRIVNTQTGAMRTLPKPIYAISPDGKWAISTDFTRIDLMRPGYGYAGGKTTFDAFKAPKEVGIFWMDLETGQDKMIASLDEISKIPHLGKDVSGNFHWFNHLLVNTDGTRINFLHRWRRVPARESARNNDWVTRMFTCDPDGGNPFIIDPSGYTSHFIWRDPNHICAWTRPEGAKYHRFYLLEDKTGKATVVGPEKMTLNGHNTYLPNRNSEWILCDTYPDKDRYQWMYLYHVPSDRRVEIGQFFEPTKFVGEWRCDLHPRSSSDGKKIMFDSTHSGSRQLYLVDLSDFDG